MNSHERTPANVCAAPGEKSRGKTHDCRRLPAHVKSLIAKTSKRLTLICLKILSAITALKSQPGGFASLTPPPVVLLRLFEISDVLVRRDDVARLIVNANHRVM